MKKQVNLKITSTQYVENLKPSGEAFKRELEKEDSLEGMEDSKMLVKLSDDSIRIRRFGGDEEDAMDMTLQPGMLNITRYQIPQMAFLDLEVYTNKLEDNLDEEGYGTISVDYKIKFDKYFSRRNILEIEVMPS